MKHAEIQVTDSMSFSYVGPPLSKGPLPAVFYFALSAQDSLQTDPYNQPVCFLLSNTCRIFTVTLPGHEEGRKPENAISYWAEKMQGGTDLLSPFFKEVNKGITFLLKENFILEKTFGAMGLSRGAFVALHVASLCPAIRFILGFAPQTRLSHAKEFYQGPDVSHFDLHHLIPKLYDRALRFYIGNLDTRVGTKNAFDLVCGLAEEAKNHRIRSAPIEMIIGPSIGYQGHGTAAHVFKTGVDWIKNLWEIS